MNNVLVLTLDSLRYDTALNANTPNLKKYFNKWFKCYTHGTYTLPAHISLLHHGRPPFNNLDPEPDLPLIFQKNNQYQLFRLILDWDRNTPAEFELPNSESMTQGFNKLGYYTIGLGGVGWFDSRLPTARIWCNYFDYYHWEPSFNEENPNSFESQIKYLKHTFKALQFHQNTFTFINVASTHPPFRNKPGTAINATLQDQINALEYVDSHIESLFNIIPKPLSVLIMSDHGTCIPKEDNGLINHGFYHPSINTVPVTYFTINKELN